MGSSNNIAFALTVITMGAASPFPAAAVPGSARVAETTAGVSGTTAVLPDVDLSRFSANDFALPDKPWASSEREYVPASVLPRSYYEKSLARSIESWQGVRYLYGGCTKSGTDCSGFVMGVFKELGIRLPHGSRYLKTCDLGPIVTGDWQYGDVLIWDSPGRGRPGHAAIYTGNGTTAETVGGRVGRSLVSRHRPPTVVRRFLDAVYKAKGVVTPDVPERDTTFRTMREMMELISQGNVDELRERLNADSSLINTVDHTGATLLHWAADRGSAECADALIDCGANLTRKKNNGVTPLHVAAALGRDEVVRLLLDRGADPNDTDFRGRTAISLAETSDRQEAMAVLRRDPRVTDRPQAIPAEPEVRPLSPSIKLRPDSAQMSVEPAVKAAPVEYVDSDDPDCREMLDMINGERSSRGLAPLRYDAAAQRIAQAKAEDIVDRDYFSHHSPSYGTPAEMLRREGIRVGSWAENIVACDSVQTAHTSLMARDDNQAGLLNPRHARIGIGIAQGGRWGRVFVQLLLSD